MVNENENRIREAEPTAAQESFERATASIASEVSGSEAVQSASQSGATAGLGGWTADEIANQFAGLFALLFLVRGDHWNVDETKLPRLGAAWLPIFQKHVPYGEGAPSWLGDAMMWIGAIGALKEIAGPAIRKEMELLKAAREKQRRGQVPSSTESTPTDLSGESSSSPESAAPENPSSSSGNSASVEHEF